ncbi:MAG: hypothetical protein ACREH4_06445 [Vitreimonas sp.]
MTQANVAHADLDPVPLEKCAYALSIVLALFAAYAWLARGGVWEWLGGAGDTTALSQLTPLFILFAVLALVLQISSNVAAAAARQALAFDDKGDMRRDFGRAQLLMIAGGAYNTFSLHHAVAFTGVLGYEWWADPVAWGLGAILAFYEPGQYWIDASLKVKLAERRALADAQRRAEQEERDNRWRDHDLSRRALEGPATQRPVTSQSHTAQPRRSGVSRAARTGGKIVMGAGAAQGVTADALAQDVTLPSEEAVRVSQAHAGEDPRVAEACRLRDKGMFRAEVAQAMGCSERTVTRLWSKAERENQAALTPVSSQGDLLAPLATAS